MVDRLYCMSSFLMFRTVVDKSKSFYDGMNSQALNSPCDRKPIHNSSELHKILKNRVETAVADGKAALALSGGIDSAILAKFMPKGSTAYTFKYVVPGITVVDETGEAARYAQECGLKHKIIEIHWKDIEDYTPILMKHKGAPIHSIEVQIYKAALQAREDGFERLIFGESADCVFGGQSSILSKDWLFGDFVDRFSYILPYKALRNSQLVLEPFLRHEHDGKIDPHEFMANEFFLESMASYINASDTAGIGLVIPYSECFMDTKIDYERIRHGENKYLVREVFKKLYRDYDVPAKLPMPRPTNEWFKNWKGPKRSEFLPHCTDEMTGDQKWLVWSLERFLNLIEELENNT